MAGTDIITESLDYLAVTTNNAPARFRNSATASTDVSVFWPRRPARCTETSRCRFTLGPWQRYGWPKAAVGGKMPSQKRATSFLDLPAEIRIEIYRLLLIAPDGIRITYNNYRALGLPIATQILYVCHAIADEALQILYGMNSFRFGLPNRPAQQLYYAFLKVIGVYSAS
jgi:hypothetical protein